MTDTTARDLTTALHQVGKVFDMEGRCDNVRGADCLGPQLHEQDAAEILDSLSDRGLGGSDVTVEDIRILFDAVIGSLDFGSGFLDGEDIDALCRVADALGVDRKDVHLPLSEPTP